MGMIQRWKQKRDKKFFQRLQKFVGTGYTSLASASWAPRDYDNFAKEAYQKNIVAYCCIDKIAKSISSVKWSLMKKTSEGPVEVTDGDWKNLLIKPNPRQTWNKFIYDLMSYYLLSGNSFLARVSLSGGRNKGKIKELYSYRPSQIKIDVDTDTGNILGYHYQQSASRILDYPVDPITGDCDLLQIKTFNPLDDIWGMATVEPAAREIDTSNAATEWNKSLLDNQGRPGMLLMYENYLTETQYKRLKKDLGEGYEGSANAGKTLILDGARDAKPYGFNLSEMDFTEGSREKARMIAAGFGVPPQLINIKGDTTYANMEQSRTIFWEDTVIPYLNMLKEEFNSWLFFNDASGAYFDYNIEDIPALAYRQDKLWQRANEAQFITENEKREIVGLDARDDGDVILVSASMMPLKDIVNGSNIDDVVTEDDIDDMGGNE